MPGLNQRSFPESRPGARCRPGSAKRRQLRVELLESRRLLAVIGNNLSVGDELQNYRLAIATTAEYTSARGGATQALASVEDLVDGLNEIFERELSIHFDLVANNNLLIFTDTATDGFNDINDVDLLLAENPSVVDGAIGNANYDIGHVLGVSDAGSQGVASLNSVGVSDRKARGASITSNPTTQGWVQLVAHEIGHQFGAQHTFNANTYDSCAGSRSSGAAYEPASGSTLMSYAGICGADNLQNDEDPFFHSASFEQIVTHIAGAGAPYSTSPNNGNAIPVVDAGLEYTIPAGTPFELTAVGSDADSQDQLTYSWEQLDLGSPQSLPLNGADSMGPLFRAFQPVADATRVFPNLDDLLQGVDTAPTGEVLPTVTRSLNFRATVRDGFGGVNSDDVLINVHDTGLPFTVTSPNTNVDWIGGTTQTIEWSVAGTNAAPINASNVSILLSTDGGQTFPFELATTTNDGSHDIVLPNIDAPDARIKIRGDGNIFFDISDTSFSLLSNPASPGVLVTESGSGTVLTEDGQIDFYEVGLTTDPSGVVTVTVEADSQSLVSLDGLTFSPDIELMLSTTAAQSVFVKAADDTIGEGGHSTVVTHSVTASSSANYPAGTLINTLVGQITDNESPPVVGVDFDLVPLGEAPPNWSQYEIASNFNAQVLNDLGRDDGVATDFDLTLQYDLLSFSAGSDLSAASSATKPSHIPSLEEVDGYNRASIPITATWSDLEPGRNYGVFVLGLETDESRALGQTVTITGDSALPAFIQTLTEGDLYVNDVIGSSDQTLESFEKVVAADGSGEIEIRIEPTGDGFALAGLAIREILNTDPGITTTRSETGTVVSESGAIDSYIVALNSDPEGEVTIIVDADADVEVSLDGVNYSSSASFVAANTLPRTVYVRAIDDPWTEGTQPSTLTHVISDSTSETYPVTLPLDAIDVPVEDNDDFAPAIGVDFDNGGGAPTSWTEINTAFGSTHNDLNYEDGSSSSIDLTISVTGGAGNFSGSNPSIVPSHSPSLVSLGGGRLSTNLINSTWESLTPGETYNVYVFARENFGDLARNTVTITGAGTPETFIQDTSNKNGILFVNSGEADAGRSLESYAVPVTAKASGEIEVKVQNESNVSGEDRVYLSGLAIQTAPSPASGVTVDVGDGLLLEEGGPTDSFTIGLDLLPLTPVEITLTADDQSELSLNGTDFAAEQVLSLADTSSTTIIVRAANDVEIEGAHVSRVTSRVTGVVLDPFYPATTYISPVTAIVTDDDLIAPTVDSILVNGGDDQRSRVDAVEITFSQVVEIDSDGVDPFLFTRVDDGTSVTDLVSVDHSSGKTIVSFTFDSADDSVTSFGSLDDGSYQLRIDAALVTGAGMILDGDADGAAGGDYVFGDEDADKFFRKYGDHSGNNAVDLLDFAALRQTFGKSSGEVGYERSLDSDGNDSIDLLDFAAFRGVFGT